VSRVPLGFLPLAAAGGHTARPSGQTTPRIEAGGPIASPGSQTASEIEAGSPTAHGTEAGSPTAIPGCQTARPYVATLPTSIMPCAAPTTICVTLELRGSHRHRLYITSRRR
jgi:hypothetical protein